MTSLPEKFREELRKLSFLSMGESSPNPLFLVSLRMLKTNEYLPKVELHLPVDHMRKEMHIMNLLIMGFYQNRITCG